MTAHLLAMREDWFGTWLGSTLGTVLAAASFVVFGLVLVAQGLGGL